MKQNYYILILLATLLFSSCESRGIQIEAPDNLIPIDSFILITTDLVVLESHIQGKFDQLNSYSEIMTLSGDSLLASYKISAERLEQSILYYGKQPHVLDTIYKQVIDTLNHRIEVLPN